MVRLSQSGLAIQPIAVGIRSQCTVSPPHNQLSKINGSLLSACLVGRPFECRQTSRNSDSIISNGKTETTDGDGETELRTFPCTRRELLIAQRPTNRNKFLIPKQQQQRQLVKQVSCYCSPSTAACSRRTFIVFTSDKRNYTSGAPKLKLNAFKRCFSSRCALQVLIVHCQVYCASFSYFSPRVYSIL